MASHVLMLRAGMIRKLASGLYSLLPLGLRVVRKIESIVRKHMDAAGAQEIVLPAVQPADIWIESGRWWSYGAELFRLRDRKNADYSLGPASEEMFTHLVRSDASSYRHLPLILYQIGTRFRDEARPRFGLLKSREFIMKDACSFDLTEKEARINYDRMKETYTAIFAECGLDVRVVEAGTGATGGNFSHEFVVMAPNGEDSILSCPVCGSSVKREKAPCRIPDMNSLPQPHEHDYEAAMIETPSKSTIEEVADFLGIETDKVIKTLVYMADGKPVAFLVRGDHDLSESKAKSFLKCGELTPAHEDMIEKVTGGPLGFSGPIKMRSKIPVYADYQVAFIESGVVGANMEDMHIHRVWHSRDFARATV